MQPKQLTDYCHQLLQAGTQQLKLPVGIVSRIFNDNYQIVAINCTVRAMKSGAIFPLHETYCREVYQTGCTIALTELGGVAGLCKHPLYVKMPLEAYISAPIHFHNQIWGTVNFTSMQTRQAFTEDEIQLVESYALLIQKKLLDLNAPPDTDRQAAGY